MNLKLSATAEKYKIKKELEVVTCLEEDLRIHQIQWQFLSQNIPTLKIGLRREGQTLLGQLALVAVCARKRLHRFWRHSHLQLFRMTT
jgi:hypothetical protein